MFFPLLLAWLVQGWALVVTEIYVPPNSDVDATRFFLDTMKDRCGDRGHVTQLSHLSAPSHTKMELTLKLTEKEELWVLDASLPWAQERLRDAYHLSVDLTPSRPTVLIQGLSLRGILYGVGAFFRYHLTCGTEGIEISADGKEMKFNVSSVPEYALRGHKIGYDDLSNTWDAWNVTQMRTYIRQLVLFTTNQIEINNPDGIPSPHFLYSQEFMNEAIVDICIEYGLNISLDYAPDSSDSNWGSAWKKLRRIDRLFVPSGDSGGGSFTPAELLQFIEAHVHDLWAVHPGCQIWISDQTWDYHNLQELYEILNTNPPKWLSGIIYGPHTADSIQKTRAEIQEKIPIAHYPDLAHQLKAQFPQPRWTPKFAFTEARESANPRVEQMIRIFKNTQPFTVGFSSYSEGITTDVNLCLWSLLGWSSNITASEFARQYVNTFSDVKTLPYRQLFEELILRVEKNWDSDSEYIQETFEVAKFLVSSTPSFEFQKNWRLQSLIFRSYYDLYQQLRFDQEMETEVAALDTLKLAPSLGSKKAIEIATTLLDSELPEPLLTYRKNIFSLGKLLYETVGLQMSVPLYKAAGIGRGACLDTLDVPLNDVRFFKAEFSKILGMPDEKTRLEAVRALVERKDPGPGGFYDNLGDIFAQPHLVSGPGFPRDPSFYSSAIPAFQEPFNTTTVPVYPRAWYDWADAFYGHPLQVHYPKLDPEERYRLEVVYPLDASGAEIRCEGSYDGTSFLIHDFLRRPNPMKVLSFSIPKPVSSLLLSWTSRDQGGNGRGSQVAELWLRRERQSG